MLGGGVDSTALELWLEGEERVGFEREEGVNSVFSVGLMGLEKGRCGEVGTIDGGDCCEVWGCEVWLL